MSQRRQFSAEDVIDAYYAQKVLAQATKEHEEPETIIEAQITYATNPTEAYQEDFDAFHHGQALLAIASLIISDPIAPHSRTLNIEETKITAQADSPICRYYLTDTHFKPSNLIILSALKWEPPEGPDHE